MVFRPKVWGCSVLFDSLVLVNLITFTFPRFNYKLYSFPIYNYIKYGNVKNWMHIVNKSLDHKKSLKR